MKTISWVTSASFVDVDFDIVQSLAQHFNIRWYILGSPTESDKKRIMSIQKSENLYIEFIELKYKWYSPFAFFEYISKLRYCKRGSDIFYIDHTGILSFYQALDFVSDKNKTVLAIHNVNTPKGARLETLAKINTYYAIHRFKNIQTFSENQHDLLVSKVSNKNVLNAPLVIKDYGEPTEPRTDFTFNFLTFGHIREYKRVDLLIQAAEELSERSKRKFKVTIVGNCKNWSQYQEKITKPELFECKIGFVENEDIPNYFACADAFVLPYQDLAQSGAITVAFRYNLPVISSNIIQFQEFNGDEKYGLMFETENSHSLSLAMERMLNMTNDEINEMRKAQAKFVKEKLSTSSITERYLEYFNNI